MSVESKSPEATRAAWAVMFAIVAMVRVGLTVYVNDPASITDAQHYDQLARTMLNHGAFSFSTAPPFVPTQLRDPGYPAFIATCYAIFGERPMAAALVQSVMGAAGALLMAWLVRRLTGRCTNLTLLICAVGFLACPLIVHAGWMRLLREDLMDVLGLAATAVGIIAIDSAADRLRIAPWVWLGLIVGFGVLGKSTHAVFLIVALLVAAVRLPWRRTLVAGVVSIAVAFACVLPWMARNSAQFGHFVLSGSSGLAFYLHSGDPQRVDGVEPESRRIAKVLADCWPDVPHYSLPARHEFNSAMGRIHFVVVLRKNLAERFAISEERADEIMVRMAKDDIRAAFPSYVLRCARNFGFYLTGGIIGTDPPAPAGESRYGRVGWLYWSVARPAFLVLLPIIALAGIIRYRRNPVTWLIVLAVLGTMALHAISINAEVRYLALADILLTPLAVAVLGVFSERNAGVFTSR